MPVIRGHGIGRISADRLPLITGTDIWHMLAGTVGRRPAGTVAAPPAGAQSFSSSLARKVRVRSSLGASITCCGGPPSRNTPSSMK